MIRRNLCCATLLFLLLFIIILLFYFILLWYGSMRSDANKLIDWLLSDSCKKVYSLISGCWIDKFFANAVCSVFVVMTWYSPTVCLCTWLTLKYIVCIQRRCHGYDLAALCSSMKRVSVHTVQYFICTHYGLKSIYALYAVILHSFECSFYHIILPNLN